MSDIDELIESMQSVSDEERFRLMNQFKEEVIQLQEEERMEAMMKVISITDSSHAYEVLKEAESENLEAHQGFDVEEKGDNLSDNIDHAIETSDMAGVQENQREINEIEEIETDEMEDD